MPRQPLTPATIVSAAAELADQDGLAAVTVAAIARTVGVQPASLYSHVRDRAAVLDGVHELALDELADRIASAVAGRAGRDALDGLAEAQRSYAREHPGRWEALQQPASAAVAGSRAANRLATFTLGVLRGYRLDGDDLVHATRLLGSMINGFITLHRAGSFGHRDPDPEASWQRSLAAIDLLLRNWSTLDSQEDS